MMTESICTSFGQLSARFAVLAEEITQNLVTSLHSIEKINSLL
jgi:hypothetical protein